MTDRPGEITIRHPGTTLSVWPANDRQPFIGMTQGRVYIPLTPAEAARVALALAPEVRAVVEAWRVYDGDPINGQGTWALVCVAMTALNALLAEEDSTDGRM